MNEELFELWDQLQSCRDEYREARLNRPDDVLLYLNVIAKVEDDVLKIIELEDAE